MSLILFYLDQAPDHAGRFLHDIWAFSLEQLESTHDFIQWLFPLDTVSPVNPLAPALTPADEAQFKKSPVLHHHMRRSLDLMLNFYGLVRITSPTLHIKRATHFHDRAQNWLYPDDHNHLRLTRILRSLHLTGLSPEAHALHITLLDLAHDHPHDISPKTLTFWENAFNPPSPPPSA